MPTALTLRHNDYVGLDIVGDWLGERRYTIATQEMHRAGFDHDAIQRADMLIVLGGSMGVYDTEEFPWITWEVAAIRERLLASKPTLGLCLGSQMMAAALGARVYRGPAKEIGWAEMQLHGDSVLAPLRGVRVFQWHGDTFDLPAGAQRLASNAAYQNQAFTAGPHALALQFHLEVSAPGLNGWLDDRDRPELAEVGQTPERVKHEAALFAPLAYAPAFATLDAWLNQQS